MEQPKMIVISWNSMGLSARIKRSAVRNLIAKHHPLFVFLQETKIENLDSRMVKSMWMDDDVKWLSSPSEGNSGGLVSLWKDDSFSLISSSISRHWIGLKGSMLSTGLICCLINIYNPCLLDPRSMVWQEIMDYCFQCEAPCFIVGDYNEVLAASDRGSQLLSSQGVNDFRNFIHQLGLVEIHAVNGHFTWFRGQSKSKLDRLFIQSEWLTSYPSLKLTLLNRGISDHCPLLVSSHD